MRFTKCFAIAGLLLSSVVVRADTDAGLTRTLNDLSNWKVNSGEWKTVNGRVRGKGDSDLEFRDRLPIKMTLSFKFAVLDGIRPRVDFHGTNATLGNEGDKREMDIHGKDVKDKQGTAVPYQTGDVMQCTMAIDDGTFVMTVNGKRLRGKCLKPDNMRLCIRAGTVEYWDFRFSDGTSASPRGTPTDGNVTVPSGRSDKSKGLHAAPENPGVIERPEFAKVPKPLVKSQTSVASMMIRVGDDGESSGIGFARGDGDETMKVSLDEAVRAVTQRYPV